MMIKKLILGFSLLSLLVACEGRTLCESIDDCKRSEYCDDDGYCADLSELEEEEVSVAGQEMSGGEEEPPAFVPSCDGALCTESFVINGDSNTDGIISPGESAKVDYFILKNNGASDILGLTGVISTDSPYLTFRDDNLTFIPNSGTDAQYGYDYDDGECESQSSCGEATNFVFDVSLDTPPNTVILINLDLVDQYDNPYHLEYEFRILDDDVNLELESFVINGDSNTDGIISPGESAKVDYFILKNNGASDILGLTGVISTDSPYLTFRDDNLTFIPNSGTDAQYGYDYDDGECESQTSCGEATNFGFDISPNTPLNTQITINLDLEDRFNNQYHLEYEFTVR